MRPAQRHDAHRDELGRGPVAGHLGDRLQRAVGGHVVERHHPAAHPPPVQLDADDRAHSHGRREGLGDEVVERLVEPGDVGDDRGDGQPPDDVTSAPAGLGSPPA